MVQTKAAIKAGVCGNAPHLSLEDSPENLCEWDKRPSGNTWSESLNLTVAIMVERCCSRYLDAWGSDCTVWIFNVGQEYSQPVLILPAKLFTGGCSCDPHQISVCVTSPGLKTVNVMVLRGSFWITNPGCKVFAKCANPDTFIVTFIVYLKLLK